MLNLNINEIESGIGEKETTELNIEIEKKEEKKNRFSDAEFAVINKVKSESDYAYSYSKLDFSCPMAFKKRYIDKEKGGESVYTLMGSLCHDMNEKLYLGKITKEEALAEVKGAFSTLSLRGLEFPTSKSKASYIEDITHYYEHFTHDPSKFIGLETEKMLSFGLNFPKENIRVGIYGFLDLTHKDKDGNICVGDFKTSSKTKFMGKELKKTAVQLALYAMMTAKSLKLTEFKDLCNIKLYWNMLKFCNIEVPIGLESILLKMKATELKPLAESVIEGYDKKKKTKPDVISDLLEAKKEIVLAMIKEHYPETITHKIFEGVERKDCLSKIRTMIPAFEYFDDRFDVKITDHYIYYDVSEDLLTYMYNWVRERHNMIADMEQTGNYPYNIKNMFYCNNLCSYNNTCEKMIEIRKAKERQIAEAYNEM